VQPEVTRDLAEFDYWSIDLSRQDPREKAQAYLALAAKYPASLRVDSAYQDAFQCEKEANDIAAAEAIYEKVVAANPKSIWPFLELAQLYIDKKIKPERAVELLDKAQKIYDESEPPPSPVHYRRITDNLEPLRGQAHLLLKNWPAARADFEAAFKAAPDKPELAYALGQTCEQMGDKAAALDAYLAAATAGYQQNPSPGEAYERLFVALGLGTKQQAEERIASRIAESNRSAATEYTPLALNRPAPDFAFTDLSGKRFDNESGKGKPTVITFWGIWCAPCIAELPGIAKFQIQHPEANALAVEIGNKPDDVKAFLAAHKLTALHVATRRDWPEEFGLTGAPTTIVLDRFGQIQFLHAGRLANVEAILGKDLEALPASN
jgi:thiol-disulfide isomerase/thioredoxin